MNYPFLPGFMWLPLPWIHYLDSSPGSRFLHLPFQKLSSEHCQQQKWRDVIMTPPFLLNNLTVMTLSRVFSISSSRTAELPLLRTSDIHSPWESTLKTRLEDIQNIAMLSICWRWSVIWEIGYMYTQHSKHTKRVRISFMPCALDFPNAYYRNQCPDPYYSKSHLQQPSDQAAESRLPNILKKCCDWCLKEDPPFLFLLPSIPW